MNPYRVLGLLTILDLVSIRTINLVSVQVNELVPVKLAIYGYPVVLEAPLLLDLLLDPITLSDTRNLPSVDLDMLIVCHYLLMLDPLR